MPIFLFTLVPDWNCRGSRPAKATHFEIQEHPELYDWLVGFRNAQRKEPLLCEQPRLYAAMRQLFMSADEIKRAAKLREIEENPLEWSFQLGDAFDRQVEINSLRNNKNTFKAQITSLEQHLQEEVRKDAELNDIEAAFKDLTGTK